MAAPKSSLLIDAERWRLRAEEVRTLAETFKDPACKKGMLDIAATYDRLAASAERQLASLAGKSRRLDRI
jgi:hypothetical protein